MNLRRQKVDPFKPGCEYVIIDTDIGGDDAQALIYAIDQSKKTNVKIIGITCTNGNTFVQDVAKNAVIVQALCNTDIPIYLGCQSSMIGNVIKDNYFSADGLGSKQKFYWEKYIQEGRLNQDLIKKDKNAMDFIIESAHQYPGKLGIIAIGPLTNLSVAYHLDNSIVEKICIVSIMGGSITGMGIRHFFSAEFNFFLDAQAAKIIIDKFLNVVIVAFDFVLQLQQEVTNTLFHDIKTEKGRFINDIYQVILSKENACLCDPIAVAPVFNPELVHAYYEVAAQVQITGPRTSGCIVFDWFETTNKKRRVKLISRIDLKSVVDQIHSSYQ